MTVTVTVSTVELELDLSMPMPLAFCPFIACFLGPESCEVREHKCENKQVPIPAHHLRVGFSFMTEDVLMGVGSRPSQDLQGGGEGKGCDEQACCKHGE